MYVLYLVCSLYFAQLTNNCTHLYIVICNSYLQVDLQAINKYLR